MGKSWNANFSAARWNACQLTNEAAMIRYRRTTRAHRPGPSERPRRAGPRSSRSGTRRTRALHRFGGAHGSIRESLQRLRHERHRLPRLGEEDPEPRVPVSFGLARHIEGIFIISDIGLNLPQVLREPGGTRDRPHEAVGPGSSSGRRSNLLQPVEEAARPYESPFERIEPRGDSRAGRLPLRARRLRNRA